MSGCSCLSSTQLADLQLERQRTSRFQNIIVRRVSLQETPATGEHSRRAKSDLASASEQHLRIAPIKWSTIHAA